jgi:hypothetical protein
MRRSALVPALAVVGLVASSASAASTKPVAPQVVDVANDANLLNSQGNASIDVPNNRQTPGVSQGYADVLSVRWQATKTVKKVKKKTVTTITGFTVTAQLKSAPTVPAGTTLAYRMLGGTEQCGSLGVVYFSTKTTNEPQSAIVDTCGNALTPNYTPIANPVISGTTMTWTVPLKSVPRSAALGAGSVIGGLYFSVNEVQDLKGQKVPAGVPNYSNAGTLFLGVLDDSRPGTAGFTLS